MLGIMSRYPQALDTLIAHLKKLPGVGRKTAERFAFELLSWPQSDLQEFSSHLKDLKETIKTCTTCGCLKEERPCTFCDLSRRDSSVLCIISSPKDAYLFEETASYKGLYHVLGALLSPIDGKHPEDLHIESVIERLHMHSTKEVIIALDATLEGDTTALFLKEQLASLDVRITRLALGLPMGSTLDYIDQSTLAQALAGRQML